MVRYATDRAARSAAVAVHRNSSAGATAYRDPAAVRCARMVQRQCGQHGVPRAWSNWPPLSSERPARGNRDASLSACAVRASCAGARHVGTHRGSHSGSAHRPDALTHNVECARTPRRNTGCHDRNADRSVPAVRSADNCTADSSARPPSCSPHAALDNAAKCGHKGSANASSSRASVLKARESFERVPGPSLIRRRPTSIAQPQPRQVRIIA